MPITCNENYRLKKLANRVKDCETVLDIGCTQLPNQYLKNKHVTGIDLIKGKLTSNYNDFILGDIDILITQERRFDAVVAGELIEHLLNPLVFLQQCYQLVKPGGILVISTPNPNSPIERLLTLTLNKKYFYTEDHIILFPQRWLIRMIEISGFNNVKLHSGGFPVPKIGLIPFPRAFCHQTIAVATKYKNE